MPVAIIARPWLQRMASAGVHSTFEVGLLKGKMIGRPTSWDIVRTIRSVKVPGWAVVPIKIVGPT